MNRAFRILLLLIAVSVFTYGQDSADGEEVESFESLRTNSLQLDIETAGYYQLESWCRSLGLETSGRKADLQRRLYQHYQVQPSQPSEGEDQPDSESIQINQADIVRYYNDQEGGKQAMELQGRVHIQLSENGSEDLHKITADRIYFNQEQNSLTATGAVRYVRTTGSGDEVFNGDSLTFKLESWNGVFLKGSSSKVQEVDGKDVTYYFSGDVIEHGVNNTIILNEGTITSSEAESPFYSISAERIYVLGEGEWGLNHAVLNIGHIPVFYLPFFFKEGDELFFNPVLGIREEEGYFYQTTTYLFGKKAEDKESDFSFMQAVDISADGSGYKVRDGLFLRATDEPLDEFSRKMMDSESHYLKIIADAYTRKGVYFGIEGVFPAQMEMRKLNFMAMTGFTFPVYDISSQTSPITVFSPFYYNSADEQFAINWDRSYLFGIPESLPFRYAFLFEGQFQLNKQLNLYLKIPFSSDNSLNGEMANRSENLNFNRLIGLEKEDNFQPMALLSAATSSSPNWKLKLSLSRGAEELRPLVTSLNLSKLELNINWNKTVLQSPLDSNPLNLLETVNYLYPATVTFPEISFSMSGKIFPLDDFIANMKNRENENEQQEPRNASESSGEQVLSDNDSRELELFSPWGARDIEEEETADDDEIENLPPLVPDFALQSGSREIEPFAYSLDYQLQSVSAKVQHHTFGKQLISESRTMKTVEELDAARALFPYFGIGYGVFTMNLSGFSLTGKINLWESLFGITNVIKLSGRYQRHLYENYSRNSELLDYYSQIRSTDWISKWNSLRANSDLESRKSSFTITDSLSASLQPFALTQGMLKPLKVDYSLNFRLYNYSYKKEPVSSFTAIGGEPVPVYSRSAIPGDDLSTIGSQPLGGAGSVYIVDSDFVLWDKEHITGHTLSLNFPINTPLGNQSLGLSMVLPPHDLQLQPSLRWQLASGYPGLSGNIGTKIIQKETYLGESYWQPENFSVMNQIKLSESISITNTTSVGFRPEANYDTNYEVPSYLLYFDQSRSAFNMGFLENKIRLGYDFSFGRELISGDDGTQELSRLKPLSQTFSLNLWDFKFSFLMQDDYAKTLDDNLIFTSAEEKSFLPKKITMNYSKSFDPLQFWDNRIQLYGNVATALDYNLIEFNKSTFTFSAGFGLKIHDFLSFHFSSASNNRQIYRYFLSESSEIFQITGIPSVNLFEDLGKSFNFFNEQDRRDSSFNLQQISMDLVTHLQDWDLHMNYSGNFETSPTSGKKTWRTDFSIYIEWNTISELKKELQIKSKDNQSETRDGYGSSSNNGGEYEYEIHIDPSENP